MILRGLGGGGPGAARIPGGLVVLRTAVGSPEPVIDMLSSLGLSGSLDPSTMRRGLVVEVDSDEYFERMPPNGCQVCAAWSGRRTCRAT